MLVITKKKENWLAVETRLNIRAFGKTKTEAKIKLAFFLSLAIEGAQQGLRDLTRISRKQGEKRWKNQLESPKR